MRLLLTDVEDDRARAEAEPLAQRGVGGRGNGRRAAEAEPYIRKALTMLAAVSTDGEYQWTFGHFSLRLGDSLALQGRLPEAEDALKQARSLFQQLTPDRFAGDPFPLVFQSPDSLVLRRFRARHVENLLLHNGAMQVIDPVGQRYLSQ